MIDLEHLREILRYEPDTGKFFWTERSPRGATNGAEAGCKNDNGYVYIQVKGKLHRAHRLAWFYATGTWPQAQIDHINRIKDDNRFSNLRLASNSENHYNIKDSGRNTSGYRRVYWEGDRAKWVVRIQVASQKIHVGRFDSFENAVKASDEAAAKYHGEFAYLDCNNDT